MAVKAISVEQALAIAIDAAPKADEKSLKQFVEDVASQDAIATAKAYAEDRSRLDLRTVDCFEMRGSGVKLGLIVAETNRLRNSISVEDLARAGTVQSKIENSARVAIMGALRTAIVVKETSTETGSLNPQAAFPVHGHHQNPLP